MTITIKPGTDDFTRFFPGLSSYGVSVGDMDPVLDPGLAEDAVQCHDGEFGPGECLAGSKVAVPSIAHVRYENPFGEEQPQEIDHRCGKKHRSGSMRGSGTSPFKTYMYGDLWRRKAPAELRRSAPCWMGRA